MGTIRKYRLLIADRHNNNNSTFHSLQLLLPYRIDLRERNETGVNDTNHSQPINNNNNNNTIKIWPIKDVLQQEPVPPVVMVVDDKREITSSNFIPMIPPAFKLVPLRC